MDTNGNLRVLLLKDLCGRLPYGVMCHINGDDTNTPRKLSRVEVDELDGILLDFWTDREDHLSIQVYLSEVKPYLRSKDDMTEEELKTYHSLCYEDEQEILERGEWVDKVYYYDTYESIDYLNSIHVDYRYLIEKDLAIKVTKDNNPYKK